jgi:hypothetical protein
LLEKEEKSLKRPRAKVVPYADMKVKGTHYSALRS